MKTDRAGAALATLAVAGVLAASPAAALQAGDVTRHDQIERDDFLASEPPSRFRDHSGRLGASICADLVMDGEVNARQTDLGHRLSIDGLRFRAVMDRECSWWNPRGARQPADYVLEHERLHFALFELEAARLNALRDEIRAEHEKTVPQVEPAVDRIRAALRERLLDATGSARSAGAELDMATSSAYVPDVQAEWLERVRAEIDRLGGGARDGAFDGAGR